MYPLSELRNYLGLLVLLLLAGFQQAHAQMPPPPQVLNGEYFLDTDPGKGNGTAFINLSGDAITSLIQNDISSLSPGSHTVNVRIMGLDSNWSPLFTNVIYTDTPITYTSLAIVQGEYFFDNDPGQGNGTPFTGLSGDAITNLIQNDISSLSPGNHTVNVRVKGIDGNWSALFTNVVYTDTPITYTPLAVQQGEYFFDTDPGQGNGTPFTGLSGDAITSLIKSGINSLSPGNHTVNVRILGLDNNWSQVFTTVINTDTLIHYTPLQVVEGEYFFDTDPGQGNGTPLVALNGQFNDAIEQVGADPSTSKLDTGLHLLSVRVLGIDGNWSSVFSVVFYISQCSPLPTASVSPAATQTICSGDSVVFTATATGTGIQYQWRDNDINIPGATSLSYHAKSAGVYDVAVTNTSGCGAGSNVDSVVLSASAVPPAVSINVSPGNPACAGADVTFTASPVNGGSKPSYQWYLDGAKAGTNSSTYSNSSLNNGDKIYCVLTSDASCATTPTANSDTISMTITAIVTPAVSIVVSPRDSVCVGTSITYTATPTNGGTAPSYQWKVNGNNAGANSSTFNPSSYNNKDVVTCVLTSNASCTTSSTATSNAVTITVDPTLTPSVTISSNVGNTVCTGHGALFTATPTNGGTAPAYQWRVNGKSVGTNSPNYTDNSITNGDVITCVLTSNAPCTTTPTDTSVGIIMSVVSSVTPSITITAVPGDTICGGITATFSASTNGGGAGPVYQWKVNGGNVGTSTNSFSSSTLNNGDKVSCVLTSDAPCATTNTATSNTISITVNSSATPTISINTSATKICAGAEANFTSTITNGGSNPVYQWMVNGNNVGANSSTFSSSSLENNSIVTCQLTSSVSCAVPPTATSAGVTMTVYPLPDSTITVNGSTSICEGDSVELSAPFNPSYSWSTTATTQNIYAKYPGDYSVTVTSVNNCIATSPTIIITVNSLPSQPSVTQSNDTLTCTVVAVGYQWYLNNVQITGATNIEYIATQDGKYQVQITDDNGCKNISADYDLINTSVNNIENGIQINIYPNPNSGSFILEADFGTSTPVNISLINTLGENVMQIEVKDITGRYNKQVDITSLPGGVYFLKIEDNDTILCRRVVKM